MLTTNTGHRSRQNAIITVKMRINAPNESGKGGSGRKVFSFLFPILNFFHFCVRLRFYNRRPQTHINTGEKEKRPEMSEHKWFRSLRAFHMAGEEGFEWPNPNFSKSKVSNNSNYCRFRVHFV